MKLIIQIPCLNEELTLPETLSDLPKTVDGFDEVEILIIDDGSQDKTVEVARNMEVKHIICLGTNRGLATAFATGVEYAVSIGADVVVNTDADNQYNGDDICRLTAPILKNCADIVVGCRPIVDHPEFGFAKRILQQLGSYVLRSISKTSVRDAASGFRAFSRHSCNRLVIHSKFSYCMETLIQAGNSGLRVGSVDIRVNAKTRDSRLFKSTSQYVFKSTGTMLSMFLLYRPFRFFLFVSSIFYTCSFVLGVRFIWLTYIAGNADPARTYFPSLILLSVSTVFATGLLSFGVVGELLKPQRKLLEKIVSQQREANAKVGSTD